MPYSRAIALDARTVVYPPVTFRRPLRDAVYSGPNFGGFGSLETGNACGCEASPIDGTAAGLDSLIRANPFIWVAGAFLLGYLAKGKR